MKDKADDALQGVNDFLRTITDRITPNIVLMTALINGVAGGVLTTGYLGEKSIEVASLSFVLFIWQFIAICILSSRHVDLTTTYLNKFIISGAVGYIWQWQFFGMYALWDHPKTATIVPLMDHNLIVIAFGYGTVMLMLYCFSGNQKNTQGKLYEMPREKNVS